MRIEKIRIQGYRSLYDVELAPRDLAVLVGPNNSGKTNLVEAVDFLGEIYRHGLELAVNRKGGIENIFHRRMRRTRRELLFDVQARLSRSELRRFDVGRLQEGRRRRSTGRFDVVLRHIFALRSKSQAIEADFEIANEQFQLYEVNPAQDAVTRPLFETQEPLLDVERSPSGMTWTHVPEIRPEIELFLRPFNREDVFDVNFQALTTTRLVTEDFAFNPLIRIFAQRFGATRLYQLVPLECRRSGVPTPNAEIGTHGANLPALVAYMRRHQPTAWDSVLDAMRRIVPGLEDVRTEHTPDRRLAVQFVERGVRRPWSSEDISDGTIQSLALFCALYDSRTPMVLIEEPENSVHPWILRNFVDACREADKQILITTHSAVLISYVTPEDIVVVWREQGRTHVQPLPRVDPTVLDVWAEGRSPLFELLDSGYVPQSVPIDT